MWWNESSKVAKEGITRKYWREKIEIRIRGKRREGGGGGTGRREG